MKNIQKYLVYNKKLSKEFENKFLFLVSISAFSSVALSVYLYYNLESSFNFMKDFKRLVRFYLYFECVCLFFSLVALFVDALVYYSFEMFTLILINKVEYLCLKLESFAEGGDYILSDYCQRQTRHVLKELVVLHAYIIR